MKLSKETMKTVEKATEHYQSLLAATKNVASEFIDDDSKFDYLRGTMNYQITLLSAIFEMLKED